MKEDRYRKWFVFGILILLCMSGMLTTAIDTKEIDNSKVNQGEEMNLEGCNRGGWWNSDWDYRKLITIDSSQVDSTLSDFPVLIYQATDSDLAAHAQSDGDDITFVLDSDDTQLNHEIEKFNGTTGELVAWVNVTSLSSSVDTEIWMYYGNPTCSSQENIDGTWNQNYIGVWHMNDYTTSTIIDSTFNNNDGTKKGANEPIETDGKIGKAQHFDNSDDYIGVADAFSLDLGTNDFTLEAWIKLDVTTDDIYMIESKGIGQQVGEGRYQWMMQTNDVNRQNVQGQSSGQMAAYDSTATIDDTNYHYVASSADRDGFITLWIDDSSNNVDMSGSSAYDISSTDSLKIGVRQDLGDHWFDGIIDEFRISKIARSADWIKTCYNTMNSPDTFYTLGVEETQPEIIVSNPYPPDGATEVELNPIMSITVNHALGNQMNITWKWNNAGSWDVFGIDSNVYNGTYTQMNINFSSYQTTYKWRVEVNDGFGNWMNKTYSFTTIGDTELPFVNLTTPELGFLYVNLFGTQFKIPFRPTFATLIIGKIVIEVNATDNDGIQWVKFYINDVLKATITEEPYNWTWDEFTIIFPYIIKVTASDYVGNENSDEINVWKLQLF